MFAKFWMVLERLRKVGQVCLQASGKAQSVCWKENSAYFKYKQHSRELEQSEVERAGGYRVHLSFTEKEQNLSAPQS